MNEPGSNFDFAAIVAGTGLFGGKIPTAAEALAGFDLDHAVSDGLSVSVDSNVDADPSHPYVARSNDYPTAEFARACASLAFVSASTDPAVRPNRRRAESVVRAAAASHGVPPVMLDPVRAEFCLDVMLFAYWFTSLLFSSDEGDMNVGCVRVSRRSCAVGAQHYLRAYAYLHAMRVVYPVANALLVPVSPMVFFVNREAAALESVAKLAGSWLFQRHGDSPAVVSAAYAAADAVGVRFDADILSVARLGSSGVGEPICYCSVVADVGGTGVVLLPTAHSLRQVASAVVYRNAPVIRSESPGAVARKESGLLGRAKIEPSLIPDVVYCHPGCAIGGSLFLAGMLDIGVPSVPFVVAKAHLPAAFAAVDYAVRAAVVARLPWLRLHLPASAADAERFARTSLSDQRVGAAINSPDRYALTAARAAASSLGIDPGHRGVEATVHGIDF